jgi:hypothetical protein
MAETRKLAAILAADAGRTRTAFLPGSEPFEATFSSTSDDN